MFEKTPGKMPEKIPLELKNKNFISSGHCKTEMKIENFNYTWSIENFWDLYLFTDKITCLDTKQPFVFRMNMNRSNQGKLQLYAIRQSINTCDDIIPLVGKYSVFLHIFEKKKLLFCSAFNFMKNKTIEQNGTVEILLCEIGIPFLHDELEHLSDDTLTIGFEYSFLWNILHHTISMYESEPCETLNFNHIVSDPNSVVIFLVDFRHLLINKSLLCYKSPVFKAMLDSCPTKNIIEIIDVDFYVMKEFLFYIQTNIPPYRHYFGKTCSLLIVANKFGVQDLKLICEQFLMKHLTIDNIIETLNIAYTYDATNLKIYAGNFLKLHLKRIKTDLSFPELVKKFPSLLIDVIELNDIVIKEEKTLLLKD